MKDRPILFSGPMVRAILDGRKTQTRRVLKWQPGPELGPISGWHQLEGAVPPYWYCVLPPSDRKTIPGLNCPYGQPGDRLWVRETHAIVPKTAYWHDRSIPHVEREHDWAIYREGWERCAPRWKPSIHMPRWASRITLEITGIRVERLQEIDEDGCYREGTQAFCEDFADRTGSKFNSIRHAFEALWDCVADEKTNWSANPWVWVVEFRRIK